jgi:hypothetical protein
VVDPCDDCSIAPPLCAHRFDAHSNRCFERRAEQAATTGNRTPQPRPRVIKWKLPSLRAFIRLKEKKKRSRQNCGMRLSTFAPSRGVLALKSIAPYETHGCSGSILAGSMKRRSPGTPLVSQPVLRLAERRRQVGETCSANDHHIHVTHRVFPASCHGTIYKGTLNLVPKGLE